MGVKWHAPAFVPRNYGPNFNNLTVDDFVTNPGKINWMMNPMHRNVLGGNPALPILHPQANISDKNPELVWEDQFKQSVPDDCLTDCRDSPTLSLQERHARTLVNDQNSRGVSGTEELCENPHSVGPSYANHHERVFCRMTDKTLWPFCDSVVSNNCFDAEAKVLVEKTRPVGKRTFYWDAIEDWHSGDRFKRAA
ncbi:hypothetical protein INS49_004248 [Diaporthe citri]|uniref:uncharacterized protein n=1 Tax=Diaporthe citri TaxID=83186 RepID=UPI001C808AC3|nr:uncharacterized protein INS49_004248 [Diaporthe citri]KAG6355167.1 hypothetical protein INS49_004248 [Diaporthe citri]